MKILFIALMTIFFGVNAEAKLNVVTSTPNLRAIAAEVGGSFADVDSIAKGAQDPHYIEAKPSFMTKISKADLLIVVGLDLEVGWIPSIVQGARNPKVRPGAKGYFDAGTAIEPLEVPTGGITRAEGDVHPFGNPHYMEDPIRAGKVAVAIAERMGELDSEHKAQFMANAKALEARLEKKTQEWSKEIKNSGVKAVITYHKTLTYFFTRFHLENPDFLEPKPGIPPTSAHTIELIELMKKRKINTVLVENFYDVSATNKIKEEMPNVKVHLVPIEVGGAAGVNTVDDLYKSLVDAIVGR